MLDLSEESLFFGGKKKREREKRDGVSISV